MTVFEWYVVVHIVCTVICYGSLFAVFQRKYDMIAEKNYWSDLAFSGLLCVHLLIGPFRTTHCTMHNEEGFVQVRV